MTAVETTLAAALAVMGRLVQHGEYDLTVRQACFFIKIYTVNDPQTVRGLAAEYGVQKPVVTRALQRLEHHGLLTRDEVPNDRRSMHAGRTPAGQRLLRAIRGKGDV